MPAKRREKEMGAEINKGGRKEREKEREKWKERERKRVVTCRITKKPMK